MQGKTLMKKAMVRRRVFLLVGILGMMGLGSLAGCGRGGAKLPPLAPVSGKVTLDRNPLPRGVVQFIPDESKGTKGPPAVGTIGSDGRFTLTTAGARGAVIGHHKVRIESRRRAKRPEEEGTQPSLIPEKYGNPDTSGLSFEVKAGQNNEFNIELHSR